MLDLKKLFARESRDRKDAPSGPESGCEATERSGDGLAPEYQSLIAAQFHRWGIDPGCVTIEVRKLGRAQDGLEVLVGLVRLAQWKRESALRVLLGLPLLENKVRKLVRSSWLGEFSHFGGLWLHASERLNGSAAHSELRRLLVQLAPPAPTVTSSDSAPLATDYGHTTDPPSTQAAESAAGDTVISDAPDAAAGDEQPLRL